MSPSYAMGAALAGSLLLSLPLLDLLLGGEGAAAVRTVVGFCGLGLLAIAAGVPARKERK
jgi:hypothetical protein